MAGKNIAYSAELPNNALPHLPVDHEKIETLATLKKAISASSALAELKGLSDNLRNPNILLNALALKEAQASSEVENIVTTQDRLYRSINLKNKKNDAATMEVLRYREAMKYGIDFILAKGYLNTRIITDIQNVIEMSKTGIRKLPGTQLKSGNDGRVIYTPPDNPDVINSLLKNFDDQFNQKDTTPHLIRMAVLHYQFESIHPYYDGNGRTGRILNILFLVLHQLLDAPVLYLSGYISQNKSEYYRRLQLVRTDDNWEEWILYVLEAVEVSARDSISKITAIRRLYGKTETELKKKNTKLYSRELLDSIFEQPYCRIEHIMKRMEVSRITASKYLTLLTKYGILQRKTYWRESLFINKELMKILTEN